MFSFLLTVRKFKDSSGVFCKMSSGVPGFNIGRSCSHLHGERKVILRIDIFHFIHRGVIFTYYVDSVIRGQVTLLSFSCISFIEIMLTSRVYKLNHIVQYCSL